MKLRLILLHTMIILLFSISEIQAQNKLPQIATSQFVINKPFDTCWNLLMQFLFEEKYNLKSQFKTGNNGMMRLDFRSGKLSYIDPKTKLIKDTASFALAEVKRRPGNRNYIYPNAGNFECLISVTKLSDNSSKIDIALDSICVMTEYTENFYLEKRRKTENVEITSTGWLERKIQSYLVKP